MKLQAHASARAEKTQRLTCGIREHDHLDNFVLSDRRNHRESVAICTHAVPYLSRESSDGKHHCSGYPQSFKRSEVRRSECRSFIAT